MKKHIFYSWQSDLPNSENRGFLETCIKAAIRELNKENEYDIQFRIDRDTLEVSGTPSIADSIFKKIDNSLFFVADVSIINSDYRKRKTPNPNVLIELGYASKVLGWDKIICIFNEDYGSYEDLPFDIKFRRPLVYSLSNKNKSDVKKEVVKKIKDNINSYNSQSTSVETGVGTYLIFKTETFYTDLEEKVSSVLKSSSFRKKVDSVRDNYIIDIWNDFEYRIDNDEPCEEGDIQHFVSIVFTDDNYSFGEVDNRECSVFFTIEEKFKQINFTNNKVYSAFEITSSGYSPSNKKRNYQKVLDELLKRL